MYIQKIKIENIKSIDNLEIDFGKSYAGWHVILGENGSGKSTLLKAVAIALIGGREIGGILPVWKDWLKIGTDKGKIELVVKKSTTQDYKIDVFLEQNRGNVLYTSPTLEGVLDFFSVGYGPFRRFSSDDNNRARVTESFPKAGAHLSLFNTEVSFAKALDWLKELDRKSVKETFENENVESEARFIFDAIKNFINKSDLLPQKVVFEKVNVEGDVIFRDGNNNEISINHLSDGYRSILSMVLDLVNQMVVYFGHQKVFKHALGDSPSIDVSGLVMIDEIDAHLHPEWQTIVGRWFTKSFPKIQFLVTTHSPLVCREAANGHIWKLSSFEGKIKVDQIEGVYKERLVHGNILDAYGTEAFGTKSSVNVESNEKRNRLGELYEKSILGLIDDHEEGEFEKLKRMMPTFRYNAKRDDTAS